MSAQKRRSPSPVGRASDSIAYRHLTHQNVEEESVKTQIIAYSVLQTVVVEEQQHWKMHRELEEQHLDAANKLDSYIEGQLRPEMAEDEHKHNKFKEMLTIQNSDLQRQIQEMNAEIAQIEREHLESNQWYAGEISKQDKTIFDLKKVIKDVQFEIDELRSKLRLEELEALIQRCLQECTMTLEVKCKVMEDLEEASRYILQLEEQIHKKALTSLELLRDLKTAESEIDQLKAYIIDLKSRIAVYIPVQGDSIDKKLAEYINNYPERAKLKIMFLREQEGIYQFGTKKVYVRVDHDKINIRVGGGFLSIDEFLDQYTPVELQKLERKDPMTRFNQKLAVQKTVQGHEVRDMSPPNKSRSPQKSAHGRR